MGKTIRLTMAQALVRFLGNQFVELDGNQYKFVKGIMGIFGHGQVTGLAQALEQDPGYLTYYRIQNEQGGVHAAIGAAKHLNRLGCFAVTSSIGPGATNMVTGAATATANRIPVLLLPGDIFVDRQPDPVLQQLEHPGNLNIQASDAFKPVCKYWDRIMNPQALMTSAINAMRVLTDPADTGAVCLALPQDVQDMAFDYPEEFFKKRVHVIDRRPVSRRSLSLIIEAITGKKRPLIIAGGGIHYSFASDALKEFVEKTGIPVCFTNAGKSAIAWDHPQNLGGVGVMGTRPANKIIKGADLVLAIGTRLMDFTTMSKGAFQDPGCEIISMNVSRFDSYKVDSTSIVADARDVLESLTRELTEIGYGVVDDYREEYTALLEEWHGVVDELRAAVPDEGDPNLPQPAVIGIINDFMNEGDVIVNAAGSAPGDLQRTWRSQLPKTYHVEYAYSCMGYEIAAGLGIKLVDPSRDVYVLQGDGGYLMLHSELVTSLIERRKITVILLDSGGFNSINGLATAMGSEGFGRGSKGFGNELRDRDAGTGKLVGPIHEIDYAMNARSYGARAISVTSLEGLKEALVESKESDITTLIHVKIKRFSQSGNYDSWWRVAVAEVSKMDGVKKAREEMNALVKTAKKF
ncbi:MAG: 3D-(3,5/4)-trihydroxycyclohexane-1,2-dione acylhydrolase (decyclizing) [Promethearchaeota archaeon]